MNTLRFRTYVLALIPCLFLLGCPEEKISAVGTWELSFRQNPCDGPATTILLTLGPGGEGTFDKTPIAWTQDGRAISFDYVLGINPVASFEGRVLSRNAMAGEMFTAYPYGCWSAIRLSDAP